MPIFALYNFDDTSTVAADAAVENGAQDGIYLDGATAVGGRAVLDGVDDKVKIYASPTFQMERGTLEIQFSQTEHQGDGPNTILSRDTSTETPGGYRIEVLADGSVLISHEMAGTTTTFQTEAGFLNPGDEINVTYSWDAANGGTAQISNLTTGDAFEADVPAGLSMNQGPINQPWIIGAGQSNSDAFILNNIDQHFQGSVEFFSLSDTVDNGPEAPVANPDTAETDEDTPVVIDVLGNDTDPQGDPLTIDGTPTAENGTVTVNPDGTLTYTPDPDYNGPDTITYTVTDPDGNTSTSTVAVTVNPVNDAPVANPDVDSTPEVTPITIAALANDTDVDGDALSILGTPEVVGGDAVGTVAVNPDGTLTFTPAAGFTGDAVINYTITDPEGLTDSSTVTVTVTPEAPVANPDTAETDEDTPVVIDVLGNDTDPQGDPLTIDGTPTAENGTVTVNPDGTLTYTPDPDYNGPDTITYTVTDPDGNTSTSTVAVTVNPVNDAPVAEDDSATTPVNTAVIVPVLANDTDVDGDALSILGTPTVVGGDAVGTVAVNPDGTISFTPATDFVGDATINYTVTDPEGLTDDAVVTVTVEAPPPPPPPERDGVVRGTDEGNLIDADYIDPFDADLVDAEDAILGDDEPNDDRIRAEAGDDTVFAGLGNDTVFAGDGDDLVYGEVGDDDLRGNAGNDTLFGGDGRDTVYGQQDNDLIDTSGGGTAPLPDIDYPGVYPADADPENDRDLVFGGQGNDTIRTGDDADTIYGDGGADSIDAGIDADLVFGGGGRDTIIGSEGADTIYGEAGNDLIFGGLDDVIGEALDIPDSSDLRPNNNPDELYGGDGRDTIYGRDDADLIYGDAGSDLLFGGIDNDTIFGGDGNDTIYGGPGFTEQYGGADRDVFFVDTPAGGPGTFIDGGEEGDDFDVLNLTGSGPLRVTFDDDNIENGVVDFLDADGNPTGQLRFINIENVIPCFTPGTLIATPKGEVPVESLRPGDRVITRDNGIQEIRWAGKKAMDWGALVANPHLRPIMIRQGSLGNGLPERDMMVSPNHRVLVANDRTALYFDEHEVLVAAKHLVGARGIFEVESVGTSYIHFMFDQHEVVLSDGAWTESFQPGDYTLKGMGNAQRNEIFELFPELKTVEGLENYMAARRTLKKHEARLLTR